MLSELVTIQCRAFRSLTESKLATLVVGTLFCGGTNILVRSNLGVFESIYFVISVLNQHCLVDAPKALVHRIVVSCHLLQLWLAQD